MWRKLHPTVDFRNSVTSVILGENPKKPGAPHNVRLYSIASTRYGNSFDGKTASLCVRRAVYYDPETGKEDPSKNGPSEKIMLLPEDDPNATHIMIATGTGVAPYRGYLRRMFMESVPKYKFNGLAWLFLGMSRRYDSRTTIFSPKGCLYHVEYAMEAIGNTGFSISILSKDGAVLVDKKKATSKLLQTSTSTEKMYKIDDHVACVVVDRANGPQDIDLEDEDGVGEMQETTINDLEDQDIKVLYVKSQRRGNLAVKDISVETKCSDSEPLKATFSGKWASSHLTLIEEKQATIGVIKISCSRGPLACFKLTRQDFDELELQKKFVQIQIVWRQVLQYLCLQFMKTYRHSIHNGNASTT
ncbi:ferredoxin--NADP reductase, root isozyme, chloroplastic [Tanacetum coccineum]